MSGSLDKAPSLEFVLTHRLQHACKRCLPKLSKNHALYSHLQQLSKVDLSHTSATIPLDTLKALSATLVKSKESTQEDVWVHQLLRGSRIYIETEKPKPRNPELVARLEKIKKQLEEQEYMRMTANVVPHALGTMANQLESARQASGALPAVPGVRTGKSEGAVSIKQEMSAVNQQLSVISKYSLR
ncbi:hypothetical protein GGI07_004691 [Coemansia sp. Benny D115]|nr:hypothetical protein GGI07_004691 [Coemansia sp. Benny D115]